MKNNQIIYIFGSCVCIFTFLISFFFLSPTTSRESNLITNTSKVSGQTWECDSFEIDLLNNGDFFVALEDQVFTGFYSLKNDSIFLKSDGNKSHFDFSAKVFRLNNKLILYTANNDSIKLNLKGLL